MWLRGQSCGRRVHCKATDAERLRSKAGAGAAGVDGAASLNTFLIKPRKHTEAASNHTAPALIWLRADTCTSTPRAMAMTASCNFVAVEMRAHEKNDTSLLFCFEL